ncbi:MAG TPA: CoA transferase, partial [Tepidiformaceae bacterium]|nr:CoA transferase [Tepidiformaceae bacterium]
MSQPLEGLRVLEIGTFVSAPYCGKLFAGYGAEVVKVEPPEGDISRAHGPFKDGIPDPETSSLFLYLNTGKKSVTLDLASPGGRERFLQLVCDSASFTFDLIRRHRMDCEAVQNGWVQPAHRPGRV